MSNRNFDFSKVFWYGCHNCILRIPMKSFEKNCFNVKQKQFLFYLFCTFSGNKFEVRQKLSDSFTKFAIITDQEKNRWKTFFVENPQTFQISLRLSAKKIGILQNFFGRFAKLSFACPDEHLEEKGFFQKSYDHFHWYGTLSKKLLDFNEKCSAKVVKTAFRVSRKLVWKTIIFDRNSFFFNFFGLSRQTNFIFSKKTQQGCQKIHSPCPGKCFREKFIFWSKCYFLPFPDHDRNVSDFDQKRFGFFSDIFVELLSKLHFRCPEEYFEELLYQGKNSVFFHRFWNLSERMSEFSKTLSVGFPRLLFLSPQKILEKILIFSFIQ